MRRAKDAASVAPDIGKRVRRAGTPLFTRTCNTRTSRRSARPRKRASLMQHRRGIPKSSWCGSGQPPALPQWLPLSAQVDLRQLVTGIRRVVRLQRVQHASDQEMRRFARRRGWFIVFDEVGFLVLSASPAAARRVMRLDRSPGMHTHALGLALGYPPCCCRAASRYGDAALDEWARALSSRMFVGGFAATSPTGYRTGQTAISHIPCSSRCEKSGAMAYAVQKAARIWRRLLPMR